jgi:hypothetical protein
MLLILVGVFDDMSHNMENARVFGHTGPPTKAG